MIGNAKAQRLLLSGVDRPPASLSGELPAILEKGVVYREDLVTLAHIEEPPSSFVRSELHDEVGIECFVNHLHIEDYEDSRDETEAFHKCLLAARILCDELRNIACKAKVLITAGGEADVTLRFHKVRPGQEWLADGLEGYDSASWSDEGG